MNGQFFTTEFLTALIASFPASIAFAILFKINRKHLLLGGVSGVITYFIYYSVEFISSSVFLAAMTSSLFTALFAEIAARLRRAPTIVFLIPGVIPTVPGGALYKAMRYALENEWTPAFDNLMTALLISLGIASGIVIITAIWGSVADRRAKRHKSLAKARTIRSALGASDDGAAESDHSVIEENGATEEEGSTV